MKNPENIQTPTPFKANKNNFNNLNNAPPFLDERGKR